MLIRLVYASTAQSGVDLNEFKRILLQAQANNHRRDLTGMLAFNSKIFLQALEGSRDQINDLYAKLLRDPRHTSVTLLNYKEIEERHWANWSMGFAAPNTDNRALFLKYSQQSIFNPYNMKADAVEKMLMELASTAIALAATAPGAELPAPAPAAATPTQPAPLMATSPLPRAPSPVIPVASASSVAPLAVFVAPAASAPAPFSASVAAPATRPAPLTQTDSPAVAKPEPAPVSGLFARFLNK
jgi:Sensors of blue-light using FAD